MKDDALVQFKLLLPAALKGRVEEAARSSRRSLSQEIVSALEEKYPSRAEAFGDLLAEIEAAKPSDRSAIALRLNKILADGGRTSRFMVRKGQVTLVSIGDWWTEEMATDGGSAAK